MPSTFFELTNKLLRKFNEVEISSTSSFASVRGIQAAAKEAIKDAVSRLHQSEYEWPFNAYQHEMTLVPGVVEYAWPDLLLFPEWESFILKQTNTSSVDALPLKQINKEEWYKYYRELDEEAGEEGREKPQYVFASHGTGFGVTPSPNDEYTVLFRYYRSPPTLEAFDDDVIIPSQWDNVIVAMAMPAMHEFRSNAELAQLTEQKANQLLSRMRGILINKEFRVYEGSVKNPHRYFNNGYIDVR